MRITEVTTHVLRAPVKTPFTSARGWWYRSKNAMLVRVSTDEGVDGWGEAYGPADVTSTAVDSLLAPVVVGADPFATDVLWHRMYHRVADHDPYGFGVAALSAVDIALWDVLGKATGQPVYRLLGGPHRTEFRAYATGLYFTSEDGDHTAPAVAEALSYQEAGFTGVKMKIALPPEQELERVRAVRGALDDRVALMVDANHGYNVPNALRLGRHFDRMGLTWFEEPIPPQDRAGYRELRQKLDLPLAGGENGFTRHMFKQLIDDRAMDILQPDVCCAGGITEARKVAHLAEAAGVGVVPHVWGSAVGMHAALHFMASLPPDPFTWKPLPLWMEYEQTENPFRDRLVREPVTPRAGTVAVPDRPGLGFEIDPEVVERYRVGG